MASTGRERMLEIVPKSLHERVPFIAGSRNEVEYVVRLHHEPQMRGERSPLFGRRGLFAILTSSIRLRLRAFDQGAMSAKHPIISVTGSSGAGTTSVQADVRADLPPREDHRRLHRGRRLPPLRPRRDGAVCAEADEGGNSHFSHFGQEANLLDELEELFRSYGEIGTGRARHYVHDADEAERLGARRGTFTPWEDLPRGTDLMIYEGLHGALATEKVNIARHADLKIGVVPVINLEWIQKIHRDKSMRGYSREAAADVDPRRMPDYVKYICPQFTETDINFQRVPTVDTSNPFIARWIPTPDESMVVIRFREPARHRLSLPAVDDPEELHVARQLDRHPGRPARPRHAAHPDADDPAPSSNASAARLSASSSSRRERAAALESPACRQRTCG